MENNTAPTYADGDCAHAWNSTEMSVADCARNGFTAETPIAEVKTAARRAWQTNNKAVYVAANSELARR